MSNDIGLSRVSPFKRALTLVVFIALIIATASIYACSSGIGSTSAQPNEIADAIANNANKAIKADAKLTQTTEYLEYSNKDIDSTTLVKCNDSNARIVADNRLDLMKVGKQQASYEIARGGRTMQQTVTFTIRDTKAPVIKLSDESPEIDQGSEYDPRSAIASVSDEVDGDLAFLESEPKANGSNVGLEEFYESGWYTIDGAINTSAPGTYSILIKAVDNHGNATTKELPVTVKEIAQEAVPPQPEAAPEAEVVAPAAAAPEYTYILNTKSRKFHNPTCRDIAKMSDANKQEITATRDEVIKGGYSPCGHCKP